MRAREYVDKATEYITDPERKLAARRELQAHLDEAMADALGKGLDHDTAELVAVGRMGAPEGVALDLAETHHKHLPWRYYAAVVPAITLIGLHLSRNDKFSNFWWWAFLLLCLLPTRDAIGRWQRLLLVDLRAKQSWLQRHHPGSFCPAALPAG